MFLASLINFFITINSSVKVSNLHSFVLRALCCEFQVGSGLVGDDDAFSSGGTVSARVESSYIINLRDLEMKHVKDFVFLHGRFSKQGFSMEIQLFFCFVFSSRYISESVVNHNIYIVDDCFLEWI